MQQANLGTVSTSTYRYPQNLNPNSSDNQINQFPPTYASAPPFSTDYTTSDYTPCPSVCPSPNPNFSETVNSQSFTSHGFPVQTHPFQPQQSSIPEHSYGIPYDLNQQASTYSFTDPTFATPTANPNSFSRPDYPLLHSPKYENSYENNANPDYPSGYIDDSSRIPIAGWRSRSGMGPELRADGFEGYNSALFHGDSYSNGAVYSYEGTKDDPYSARGVSSASPSFPVFDDYGRPITVQPLRNERLVQAKIVRATPKVETEQDVGCGIQKFRVKLLPEGGGQTTMDVLCQVGLDGIRMLDPGSGLTLRIYPLDNITRCQVMDSSTFVFWSKSSVDVEPRRIRLQSNSYTTNTLLDTVTAATVQLKEMGGRGQRSEPTETVEQSSTKKKSFGDWMNRLKPTNEERDHWVPDEVVTKCTSCGTDFSAFVRRHHCRNCGDIFCDKCTHGRIALTAEENTVPVRVCDRCMAEATQRLSNAKDSSVNKFTGLQSHGDLAKKLQEEMKKNQRASSGGGAKSDSSSGGRRMKEVTCPTCTVHLQVQAPSVGSETIECGVCQHPFLVTSH